MAGQFIPSRALFITNGPNPIVIGDTIAALPTAQALAKADHIDCVIMSTPSVVDLFDVGVPQYIIGSAAAAETEIVLTLDTAVVYSRYSAMNLCLESLYALAAKEGGFDIGALEPLQIKTCLQCDIPEKPFLVLAPFSHSDLGTKTKLWDFGKWCALMQRLADYEMIVLGTIAEPELIRFAAHKRMLNRLLGEIAYAMLRAQAVITVDNGMGWLARALDVPHVQILSANMAPNFAWHPGENGRNISNCHTATVDDVVSAILSLRN